MERNKRQNTTALRFPPDLHERLRKEADERGVSIQWLVNQLLVEGLDNIIPAVEFRLTRGGKASDA